jgi:YegS/Rv2252/BmrU family lipid kinase
MKPLIILNPSSRGGQTGAHAAEIERTIIRHLGASDSEHTTAPRHAVAIAERAADEGRELVVAVGGDGTIHEVVNGLMRARDRGLSPPRLGIVGRGTGGDFRKTLGLEHRLERYCAVLAAGRSRTVDVGRFQYRDRSGKEQQAFFVNILSAGLGGLVDQYVGESSGKLGGTLTYLTASVRALIDSEVGELRCVLYRDGVREERELGTRLIAICNGRYFGSGMEAAPMAEPDDGLLEVVSLGAGPKLDFVLSMPRIYRGTHLSKPGVETFRCQAIDIELVNETVRDRFLLDVDGEPLGTLPVQVEVVPGALEVMVG